MEAELEIAGSRFVLRGPAKYHEQAQVTPRFVDAFSYLAYWGAQSSGVAIRTLANSSGATLEGPKAAAVVGFRATPLAAQRRFELARRGTEPLSGELTTLTRFSLPIFGERWQGTFVRGRAGSDPVVGMFNSWRAEGLSDLA